MNRGVGASAIPLGSMPISAGCDAPVFLDFLSLYQPRAAISSRSGMALTSMPTIGSPSPRETSARIAGSLKCVVASTMACALRGRVARLEDAGADEDAFAAKLHHQRRVGRRRHAARGRSSRTGSSPVLVHLAAPARTARLQLLGLGHQLVLGRMRLQPADARR